MISGYSQLIIDCAYSIAPETHEFLIAPHIISITFNSSLAMVYFLGRLEVRIRVTSLFKYAAKEAT